MTLDDRRLVEICVQADRDAVDDLMGLFSRYCSGGAAVDEVREGPEWPPQERGVVKGFMDESDHETQQKLEIALLLLSKTGVISAPSTRVLEASDWAESWKAFFPPLPIGERFVVVPSWIAYDVPPGRLPLYLDPGMAFGTGLHATTRLCLIAMETQAVSGAQVLDVGTGSGILSIAAALLGAAHVDAVDVDPICVQVTQANSARNQVEGRITVTRATLPSHARTGLPYHEGGPYDLLLINILAEIIIDMSAGLPAYLKPGGTCIASGILADKSSGVQEALEAAGLTVQRELLEEGWAALVVTKPA
jgi:ribosomal protein L11 methyltransferase